METKACQTDSQTNRSPSGSGFFIGAKSLIKRHLHKSFKKCSFVLLTPLCAASMFDKVFQICRFIN
ncbi:hypothetical protein DR996_01480 [Vibrio owensii]|nr:hypothetical protein DR996_01480 [Vibrio owensii]